MKIKFSSWKCTTYIVAAAVPGFLWEKTLGKKDVSTKSSFKFAEHINNIWDDCHHKNLSFNLYLYLYIDSWWRLSSRYFDKSKKIKLLDFGLNFGITLKTTEKFAMTFRE